MSLGDSPSVGNPGVTNERRINETNTGLANLRSVETGGGPSVSRLSNLLRQVETLDSQLASDLRREVDALSARRTFGLNFERHTPETVALPNRTVRKGDKVRFVPQRGATPRSVDNRLWWVNRIRRTEKGRMAELVRQQDLQTGTETASRSVDDLVVIAEFRDPIYPGLNSNTTIERGGDKPFHTVINAENFHALQALFYTHEGKVDAVYIDPPYNGRARDWKYNNDYVDTDDAYKHSKWLAMMERRLKVAKRLLKPEDSALIVTIDEKEVHRLGLLLQQVFPNAHIEVVTSVISAKGVVRSGQFSRVEEHIFFVTFGDAKIEHWVTNMLPSHKEDANEGEGENEESERKAPPEPIEWLGLRRRESSSSRGARPNQFYPIFVNVGDGTLHSIGAAIDDDVDRHSVPVPRGTVALWPLKPDGTEMLWGLTPDALRRNWTDGFARVNWRPKKRTGTVYYLPSGTIEKVRFGKITVTGRAPDGSIEGHVKVDTTVHTPPKRVWNLASHNAETGGTKVLSRLIPGRHFPYPKSLYAVEDALRFIVGRKQDAIILDFFAGSGTTAHAVMRLNKQDEGRRQSISVTNNEVSANEERSLRREGLRPGDPKWEAKGICEYITKPRIAAAVTGKTPGGRPIQGNYKFTDKFPMTDGFEENVEFLTMTYESPRPVAHNRAFAAIATLLWLRAGSQGRRINEERTTFDVADTYAVLFDLDASSAFLSAIAETASITTAFIVTDDDRGFQAVCAELPVRVEALRLYESYLANFTINTGRE